MATFVGKLSPRQRVAEWVARTVVLDSAEAFAHNASACDISRRLGRERREQMLDLEEQQRVKADQLKQRLSNDASARKAAALGVQLSQELE